MKKEKCNILLYDSQLISAMAMYKFLHPCFGILVAANLREAKVILETIDLRLLIMEVFPDDADFQECLQMASNKQIKMIGIESLSFESLKEITIPIIRRPIDHRELTEMIFNSLNCSHETNPCKCFSCLQNDLRLSEITS